MNYTKLVETVKTVARERREREHHSRRYERSLTPTNRYKPDKQPQLAETEKEEETVKRGRTDTGSVADKINFDPQYYSQMSPTRGMSKPPIDNK